MFFKRNSSLEEMEERSTRTMQDAVTNSAIAFASIKDPKKRIFQPSAIQNGSKEESSEAQHQSRKSGVNNIGLTNQVMPSPKLRNRFSWNTPMSSLRKKINRRSMPTIDDDAEENDLPSKTPSVFSFNEEDFGFSKEAFAHQSSTTSSGASDSIFDSPPATTPSAVMSTAQRRSKSDGLLITNAPRVSRSAYFDLATTNRTNCQKPSAVFSPSRFLEDFKPMPGPRFPSTLRRGSTPVSPQKLPPGISRQRSGVVKIKVSTLACLLNPASPTAALWFLAVLMKAE